MRGDENFANTGDSPLDVCKALPYRYFQSTPLWYDGLILDRKNGTRIDKFAFGICGEKVETVTNPNEIGKIKEI